MEPEKNLTGEKMDQVTLSNLKEEGVEIEASSRHAEENEFTPEPGTAEAAADLDKALKEETSAILAQATPAGTAVAPTPRAPVTSTAPIAPRPTVPVRPPEVRERQAPPSANDPSIHQLRTFRMDAEEAVKYQGATAVSIAIAEQKRKETTPVEYVGEEKSKMPIIILALLVVLVAAGVGAYFYMRTGSQSQVATQPSGSIRTPISYQKSIVIPDATSGGVVGKMALSARGVSGTVGSVVFFALPDVGTTTKQVSPSIALAGTHAPDKLIRALTGNYMFGIHIFDGSAPFIILKISFFQNAFPGMLEWEKDMRNDLLPLIQIARPNVSAIDANTDIFRDRVIANKDVRELDDVVGSPILLYTFADKDTILITTNEKSLKEILDMLLAVRVVQ